MPETTGANGSLPKYRHAVAEGETNRPEDDPWFPNYSSGVDYVAKVVDESSPNYAHVLLCCQRIYKLGIPLWGALYIGVEEEYPLRVFVSHEFDALVDGSRVVDVSGVDVNRYACIGEDGDGLIRGGIVYDLYVKGVSSRGDGGPITEDMLGRVVG